LACAGLVLALATGATEARAAELGRLTVSPTARGARVSLDFSAPTRVDVRELRSGDRLGRLYVDLPMGTRVGRAVSRAVPGAGPVDGLRVGARENGAPRLVVELADGATYRVGRTGALVLLEVSLPQGTAKAAAPAPPPAPPPGRPTKAAASRRDFARPRIVIDPGHGGRDPGAQGHAVEKVVTLAVARRLATHLRERLGAETILTRSDDATLELADRTERANGERADLFVSIHANASRNTQAAGIETYYLTTPNDRATIRLAAMENGLDYVPQAEGTRLRYILSDLLQVGKIDESVRLARKVQRSLVGHLGARYPDVADLGVKQGPFYVLVGAHMPCVLVEVSFLTHPVEGRRLATDHYQAAVAEGLYAGIAAYLADDRRGRTL
jgi:N-acetylmuramoyl-L-alanine amidase